MSRRRAVVGWGILLTVLLVSVLPASAATIINPQRGGDDVGGTVAPMIMPLITVAGNSTDGWRIEVLKEDASGPWETLTGTNRPIMRPLSYGHELSDSNVTMYNALNGTAWNWQYGWASGSFNKNLAPADSNIFIQLLDQSDGLQCYDRTANSFAPIFTPTSDTWRWNWNMSMQHNAYTVAPQYGDWSATYKVYLGNTATGAPIAGWGFDTVTFSWVSIPEPATMSLLGTGFFCLIFRKHRKQ